MRTVSVVLHKHKIFKGEKRIEKSVEKFMFNLSHMNLDDKNQIFFSNIEKKFI